MHEAQSEQKVALVTGASRGLGRAIAWRLHEEGFSIVVNFAADAENANTLVDEITSVGGSAVAVKADVSNPKDVVSLFDTTFETFGRLDVVVNNAGVSPAREHIEHFEDSHFDEIINVNLKGVFYCMKESARRLSEGGRIITLSSSTVELDAPGAGPYAASKAGAERLTKILSKELAGRSITVNAVAPGLMGTDLAYSTNTKEQIDQVIGMTPLGKLGDPEDVAAAVAYLASDDGAFINGATIAVNGGLV